MRSQRAVFTLHGDLETPLNKIGLKNIGQAAWKVTIPTKVFGEVERFLKNAGVNEFSLFPDLDGLSRHLRDTEVSTLPKAKVKGLYVAPPKLWMDGSKKKGRRSRRR
jgi:hypothetical protein